MTPHELFMQRAFELALLGSGSVSPNPLVGCVIVHDGKVIGEGWHQKYGEAHAEVNAVNAVQEKGRLEQSTVYVNLEPCAHFGKTPPCADLLIHHKVKSVVIANADSNPLVAGRGIARMKEAGIAVTTGVLEQQGLELNRRFFTFMEKLRPYVVLKWAQTADGFIAHENYDSKWISDVLSRQLVHKWRTEEDAVLVGARTAAHDNPKLSVRDWTGRNPMRVVIDPFLKLSEQLNLFDRSQPTLCYNVLKHEEHHHLTLVRLDEDIFLEQLLKDLHHRKIQSIMVEGGAHTLASFINSALWDEARVFTSASHFEKGIAAPRLNGKLFAHQPCASDWLSIYRP
jgi:diaminohydroxyphosphoribosylaminopyrimidine deaminase/5-amino-6-(5-phosphoribosylamino)uracil reductase